MKTVCSVIALCLVLCFSLPTQAGRLERTLKQNQPPTAVSVTANANCVVVNGRCAASARVSTQAENDAARSIARALSSAIASVNGGGDVNAAANSFATAIATAYARIITSSVLTVFVRGNGQACAYTASNAQAFAQAIARATSRAFADSSNANANAAATCTASAVATAAVTATQRAFLGVCTNYGFVLVRQRLITIGFAQAVASTAANVFTAIRDNNASAAASCSASAVGNTGQITFRG